MIEKTFEMGEVVVHGSFKKFLKIFFLKTFAKIYKKQSCQYARIFEAV